MGSDLRLGLIVTGKKIWFWNTSNHLKRQPLYSGLWANVLIYSQSNDMNNSFLG